MLFYVRFSPFLHHFINQTTKSIYQGRPDFLSLSWPWWEVQPSFPPETKSNTRLLSPPPAPPLTLPCLCVCVCETVAVIQYSHLKRTLCSVFRIILLPVDALIHEFAGIHRQSEAVSSEVSGLDTSPPSLVASRRLRFFSGLRRRLFVLLITFLIPPLDMCFVCREREGNHEILTFKTLKSENFDLIS